MQRLLLWVQGVLEKPAGLGPPSGGWLQCPAGLGGYPGVVEGSWGKVQCHGKGRSHSTHHGGKVLHYPGVRVHSAGPMGRVGELQGEARQGWQGYWGPRGLDESLVVLFINDEAYSKRGFITS